MADEEIIEKAARESRIILTFDSDFPRLLAQLRLSSPSVVLIRLERFETHAMTLRLLGLLRAQESELSAGVVLVVEPSRVRMHRLPLGQPPVE
jgi:predicted nuclease of predicted toxin-antitoxin system